MDLCTVRYLLIFSAHIHLTSAASHSLQYVYTAVTQRTRFPEFTVVGLLDGEQIVYYDSNSMKVMPKTEWMREIGVEDSMALLKASVDTLMKRFNQTKGVQTLQRIYGCELHDDGTKTVYDQFGCDGVDVLSLDLNTGTWTAANRKAVSAKHKWEKTCDASFRKARLENECIFWLKKFVEQGRSTLERKVPPKVSLFQKDSSSPVVCHATGFFPKAVMISWQKNGEDLHEDVELRETLPNQDGTFQKRSVLTVSPEELDKNKFTCIIQHGGLEKELELQVSERRVLPGGGPVNIIIGAVVGVLLLILIGCIGVFIFKKRQSGFKPVAGNPNAELVAAVTAPPLQVSALCSGVSECPLSSSTQLLRGICLLVTNTPSPLFLDCVPGTPCPYLLLLPYVLSIVPPKPTGLLLVCATHDPPGSIHRHRHCMFSPMKSCGVLDLTMCPTPGVMFSGCSTVCAAPPELAGSPMLDKGHTTRETQLSALTLLLVAAHNLT
ncbi:hypothetical protein AOLI_G00274790 [Acnodon oligacanthus]